MSNSNAADTLAKIILWVGGLFIVLPILFMLAFGLAMVIIGLSVA